MSFNAVLAFLVPAMLGVLIGFAIGGRLSGLATSRPKALWLLWVAVALHACHRHLPAVVEPVERRLPVPMLAVIFALVLAWLAVNLRHRSRVLRAASAVIAVGMLLNGVVIFANGHMPYSARAAAAAHIPAAEIMPKDAPSDQTTRLVVLADAIPVPALRAVASPGDAVIAVGIALAMAGAMWTARKAPAPSPPVAGGGESLVR